MPSIFCHILSWFDFIQFFTQNLGHYFKGHIIFGQKFEIPIIVVQLPVETGLQNHDSLTRKSVIGHHFKVHIVAKVFSKLK